MNTTRRHLLRGLASLGLATTAWATTASTWLAPDADALFDGGPLPDWVRRLAEGVLHPWESGSTAHLLSAGASNREWDFMGRTFGGLALIELALRDPSLADRCQRAVDGLIEDTLRAEAAHGFAHFLMPYGQHGGWVQRPEGSLFVDGELATLLAARQLVWPDSTWSEVLADRVARVQWRMKSGPILSGESYPDECWTFCNSFALVALRLAQAHGLAVDPQLPHQWLERARRHLIEPGTGLLVSSYRLSGAWLDGPEGSSLWVSAHNLRWVDPAFAELQYRRAQQALSRSVLGFGYAREWPPQLVGHVDVDSGPVIPGLQASPGSSGLELIAAGAFGDRHRFDALTAAMELVALPDDRHGRRHYRAGNAVGDAVALYAAVQGPLFARAMRRVS